MRQADLAGDHSFQTKDVHKPFLKWADMKTIASEQGLLNTYEANRS